MPIPTAFHPRTAPLVLSHEWRNWAGYLAAGTYEPSYEREYFAIRNAAALIDVSPLFKYEVAGRDAERLLNRVVTRDLRRCAVGQVVYTPWCDEDGFIIDDGTVARLAADRFRLTSADPSWRWLADCGYGLEAEVRDVSSELAAVALQGPRSREILARLAPGAGLEALRYFRLAQLDFEGAPLTVTRTGYTGDLGYELWVPPAHAPRLWDRLMAIGRDYAALPAGIIALDLARVEAGLLMIDVDYIGARKALIAAQKSTPADMGLEWTVALDKPNFVGRRALRAEKARGPKWRCVGLDIHWEALERLFGAVDLAPRVAGRASRSAVPVYDLDGQHIGQATSTAFSPLLKRYLAIATVERPHGELGEAVEVEFTVEYVRHKARATVVKMPFYDPQHKRQNAAAV
jgi:aminomethyltransferase